MSPEESILQFTNHVIPAIEHIVRGSGWVIPGSSKNGVSHAYITDHRDPDIIEKLHNIFSRFSLGGIIDYPPYIPIQSTSINICVTGVESVVPYIYKHLGTSYTNRIIKRFNYIPYRAVDREIRGIIGNL